jgi:hypothetical protein
MFWWDRRTSITLQSNFQAFDVDHIERPDLYLVVTGLERRADRCETWLLNGLWSRSVPTTRTTQLWASVLGQKATGPSGRGKSGTAVLKFFLHISKQEQLARFEERLDDPTRNWKISESDYSERELWGDYITAFEDAINDTSTPKAPWYVVPANHKWFRNLAVSQIMVDAIEELGMALPKPSVDLSDIRRKYHAAVEEEHKHKIGG